MSERLTWASLYAVTYCVWVSIYYQIALLNADLSIGTSVSYLFEAGATFILFVLALFLGITWFGLGKPQRKFSRALGQGFLIWVLLLIPGTLAKNSGLQHALLLEYLLNILFGYTIIWHYKFSYSYIWLPTVLPWFSILYLLVAGRLRTSRNATVLV